MLPFLVRYFYLFYWLQGIFIVIFSVLLLGIVLGPYRLNSKWYMRTVFAFFGACIISFCIINYSVTLAKPYLVEKEVFLSRRSDKNASKYKYYVIDAFKFAGFKDEKIPVKEKNLVNVAERYEVKYVPNTKDHSFSKSDLKALDAIGKYSKHYVVKKYYKER